MKWWTELTYGWKNAKKWSINQKRTWTTTLRMTSILPLKRLSFTGLKMRHSFLLMINVSHFTKNPKLCMESTLRIFLTSMMSSCSISISIRVMTISNVRNVLTVWSYVHATMAISTGKNDVYICLNTKQINLNFVVGWLSPCSMVHLRCCIFFLFLLSWTSRLVLWYVNWIYWWILPFYVWLIGCATMMIIPYLKIIFIVDSTNITIIFFTAVLGHHLVVRGKERGSDASLGGDQIKLTMDMFEDEDCNLSKWFCLNLSWF